ncbi:MAG TPA: DinB family protein [Candidatus Dormibacteraeota bacterium]|nr:DinB family protein [Candidatus Dormibacteraeota bacterium]
MRIESPAFTEREMQSFLDEILDVERGRLADRLEADSTRLADLVGDIPTGSVASSGPEWSAQDILAHIVVLSKFYGVLTSRVGSGKVSELDLLPQVKDRDVAGEQLSSLPPDQLLAFAQRDHQRTIAYLRSADAAAMRRRAVLYEGFSMSAGEIAAMPLCAHLEIHLDQLERTLRP